MSETVLMPLAGSCRPPITGSRIKFAIPDEATAVKPVVHVVFKPGAADSAYTDLITYAESQGLELVARVDGTRTVTLRGSAKDISAAFDTALVYCDIDGRQYRARAGALSVPESVSDHVLAVLGLDNRPQANPRLRYPTSKTPVSIPANVVARAYGYPLDTATGAGQTIAILALGGGLRDSDLTAYCAALGITKPAVEAVGVGTATNAPGIDPDADAAVALDIQVAAAVAPGAHIAVYFVENTAVGFLDGINAVINDVLRQPSVLSISWGAPESSWTPQAMAAIAAALDDAATAGITVTIAAGDEGATDGCDVPEVDFPASSPAASVIACGGTHLTLKQDGTINSQTVWNSSPDGGASGGGVSAVFSAPDWQSSLALAGRAVPDVAANADPEIGYPVCVDGRWLVLGGTSAVASLIAGLVALAIETLGRPIPGITALLYSAPIECFADVTTGNNAVGGLGFPAGSGFDPCSGLGSPLGIALIAHLQTLGQSLRSSQEQAPEEEAPVKAKKKVRPAPAAETNEPHKK